jgi:hypothetical protein
MKVALSLAAAAGVAAAMPAAALAADGSCRAIKDPLQRLACYDAREDAKSQDKAAHQKAEFGLNEKQKPQEDRNEVSAVSSKITQVSGTRIVLENGAVWQFDRDSRVIFWVRPGQGVTIKRGLVGGYRASVDGVSGVEVVTRVQ